MTTELEVSGVVGEWEPGLTNVFICPPPVTEVRCAACGGDPATVCECGYDGTWEHRWVHVWNATPGSVRPDWVIRRDMSHGWPARPNDEGYWVMGGYDERCPGCGDIERFDLDANRVRCFSETAAVTGLHPR